jgi:CBS domain-containing protein
MKCDPVTISPDMTLSDYVYRTILAKCLNFVPIVDAGLLLGHMDRNLLSGIDRENWDSTQFGDVFVGLNDQNSIDPDSPIQDMMTRMSKTGLRKFMVVEDHKLVGVLSLVDLIHYLQPSERAMDL